MPPSNSEAAPPDNSRKGDLLCDAEQAYLLYACFCGDAIQTGHALNLSPDVVKTMAIENQWDTRLKPIIALQGSARAGDVERAINRALNFVSAHRMRMLLERVLKKMFELSPQDLDAFIFPQELNKKEQKVYQSMTTRALADLASALEKCQMLTYSALNDTPAERKVAKEEGSGDATAAEMHVRLAQAMQAAGGGSRSIKALVADAQMQVAQDFARVDLLPPEKQKTVPL